MPAGITVDGFELKTTEEILNEVEAEQLATISPTLDTSPDQPLGQINAIFASKLSEAWEGLQVAYNAFNRAAAEGVLLDNIGLITGTVREAATKGTVTLTCNLNSGTALVVGSATANVSGNSDNRWVLKLATGTGWSGNTFTAPTTGNHSLVFEAENTGVINANSGTITVITTPVSGWNSVTNADDATPGAAEQTDVAYRLSQLDELSAPGACTPPAIRADLLQVTGVIEAFVYENLTDVVDTNNMPPHTFEAVIWDGATLDADNTELATVILNNRPAGIASHGTTSVTVQDAQLFSHVVKFSRCTQKDVKFNIELTKNASTYAGDTAVKEALAAIVLKPGEDVILNRFRSIVMGVAGVVDVTLFQQAFVGNSFGTSNLAVTRRQIAQFDTGDITVTSSEYSDDN